jgi:hypothetical protein
MKAKPTASIASPRGARIAAGFAYAACWAAPMVPAIRVNLDSAASQRTAWTVFAVSSVIFAAVCIGNAFEVRGVAKKALFALLGAFFLALNVLNALGNAAGHSEDRREHASSQIQRSQRLSDARTRSSQAREDQIKVAGTATPESIEGEIQAAKAKDAKRWNATEGCKVEKITAGPTRDFCADIAKLEAKLSAAKKRDELDAKIAELDRTDTGAAPESTDPFAANIAHMIALLGYQVDDGGKTLIASIRDWGKALGVELMAGFGPAGLLLMLARIGSHSKQAPEPRKLAVKRQKEASGKEEDAPKMVTVIPSNADAEIDGFIAACLEFVQGEFIAASPLFKAWGDYCPGHGIIIGSAKGFSNRIKRRVQHDPNSGRPRYAGVRLKDRAAGPRLRVVSA